jgi:hypothetical protein
MTLFQSALLVCNIVENLRAPELLATRAIGDRVASGESFFKKQSDEVLKKFREKCVSSVSMNSAGIISLPAGGFVEFTADPRLTMSLQVHPQSDLRIFLSQGQSGALNQIASLSEKKLTFRERKSNALKNARFADEDIVIKIMGSRISINQHQFLLPVQQEEKSFFEPNAEIQEFIHHISIHSGEQKSKLISAFTPESNDKDILKALMKKCYKGAYDRLRFWAEKRESERRKLQMLQLLREQLDQGRRLLSNDDLEELRRENPAFNVMEFVMDPEFAYFRAELMG